MCAKTEHQNQENGLRWLEFGKIRFMVILSLSNDLFINDVDMPFIIRIKMVILLLICVHIQ